MSNLRATDRLIINQLFNNGVFTRTITPKTTGPMVDAINALKKPANQQRLNSYFKNLLGVVPDNYQENLLFLFGTQRLEPEAVHVLLATIKAVINLPELQNTQSDRVVATQTIIRQVHSEVVTLNEKEIRRQITALFVDRFALFVPDLPDLGPSEQTQTVEDYWDVSPDFNYFAQCLVNHLQAQTDTQPLTPVQRVNRALLTQRYLSRSSKLWPDLLVHKAEIAEQWAQLGRFDLECGDDYALLLDNTRQPSKAKPFVVAIAVANSLGVGIPSDMLTTRIHLLTRQIFPETDVSVSLVKQALTDNGLVKEENQYVSPTPIVSRFVMRTMVEQDAKTPDEGEA